MSNRPVKLKTTAELKEIFDQDPETMFRIVNTVMSIQDPDYEKKKMQSRLYAREQQRRQKQALDAIRAEKYKNLETDPYKLTV